MLICPWVIAISRVFKAKTTHTHLPELLSHERVFATNARGYGKQQFTAPFTQLLMCTSIIYNLYMYIASCLLSYFIICRCLFQVDVVRNKYSIGCFVGITTHDSRSHFSVAHAPLFHGTVEHHAWSTHKITCMCEVRSGLYLSSASSRHHWCKFVYIHMCYFILQKFHLYLNNYVCRFNHLHMIFSIHLVCICIMQFYIRKCAHRYLSKVCCMVLNQPG